MNEWLNAPLSEFVKIPWDRLSIGCHIKNGKLLCANIQQGSDLFKAIDFTVPIQSTMARQDLESILLGIIYLLMIWFICIKEEHDPIA
jgi:hypothetical protein